MSFSEQLGQISPAQLAAAIATRPNKDAVRVATTANITIATALNNGDTLDGVTLATNDRVLVKNQSTGAQNGIYVVGASPARATDFDAWTEIPGAIIPVLEGTVNGDKLFKCTNNAGGTLGTTAIVFADITSGLISDTAYDATSWNGVIDVAPSKNAVRDKIEAMTAEILTAMRAAKCGVIEPFAGAGSLPTGTLECNGQEVSQSTYAALWAQFGGHIYGADPGGGNFVLPDLRNRSIFGSGSTYALAEYGGEATHTLTESELPSHTHTVPMYNSAISATSGNTSLQGVNESANDSMITNGVGSGTAHNNMPPYLAMRFVIYTGL